MLDPSLQKRMLVPGSDWDPEFLDTIPLAEWYQILEDEAPLADLRPGPRLPPDSDEESPEILDIASGEAHSSESETESDGLSSD